ncbi:E3 ubiquitin-protein ligase RNF168 [Protopterus annectens]|uniref:E3 ubiquitin-protein ligase RNF168 n=1 Tax=Protopterus annectens TaxID=7888 RepID=UPI001CF97DF2|nr:E3 ubiquitin-protein ligase RNF168 [Protopterus annectens]XP_043926276.1 E3 ubiquitin-protein ligase RNF168 [Protopterus annectens]XP_043926277.1 E3 ubiquitin-protein ligase RNF168 [Protopterus annectens]XP_043926278.1 E3 ubiquitin-protein ligase RNF168 [Protopterus annectens]
MTEVIASSSGVSDYICPICREIFLEPVTLPCNHTLCNPCFQLTVEKANLCCPLCRRRVSSWARYHSRRSTLINLQLWDRIQQDFPEQCQRRANGQDVEIEVSQPFYPPPLLSKPGELRAEYEAQMSKCEAERRALEEEERKASEEYIQKLLEEEEEESRKREGERKEEEARQLRKDEELARVIYSELNVPPVSEVSNPSSPPGVTLVRQDSSLKKRKSIQKKAGTSGDIKRYLSPGAQQSLSSQLQENESCGSSSNTEKLSDVKCSRVMQSTEGLVCDEPKMPTLIPQNVHAFPSSVFRGSVSELDAKMPKLFSCIEESASILATPSTSKATNEKVHIRNQVLASKKSANGQFRRKNNGELEKCVALKISLAELLPPHDTGMKCPKMFPADVSECSSDNRTALGHEEDESNSSSSFDYTEIVELEEELYQKYRQELADRQLAMKLQKQLDKEQNAVSRQKGSPDEYRFRPRTLAKSEQKDQTDENVAPNDCGMLSPHSLRPCEKRKNGDASVQTRETKQLKPSKSCTAVLHRDTSGSSSSGVKNSSSVLQNSSKQQTIFQMFQKRLQVSTCEH